jgi:cbb3-type cytochrome oxidase subunit 3
VTDVGQSFATLMLGGFFAALVWYQWHHRND